MPTTQFNSMAESQSPSSIMPTTASTNNNERNKSYPKCIPNPLHKGEDLDHFWALLILGVSFAEIPMFYSAIGGDFENIYLPVSLQNYGIFITCRFFFAVYLLARPEKKYRLPCWKLNCIAEICSVVLAMGLGFVFPYQMECLGILASWTVQLYGYCHLWFGFLSQGIWECYAIVPMQLLTSSNMIKTIHPFLFSLMALGGWAFVSINVGLTYSELLQEPKVAKSAEEE